MRPDFNLFREVEKIHLAQDVFGTSVPVDIAFNNPREIADYVALQLKGWGPNSVAVDFLKRLAIKRNSPTLAQGLHSCWRMDQISAVVQEIFHPGDLSAGGNKVLIRKPSSPKSGAQAAAQSLDEDDPIGRC